MLKLRPRLADVAETAEFLAETTAYDAETRRNFFHDLPMLPRLPIMVETTVDDAEVLKMPRHAEDNCL